MLLIAPDVRNPTLDPNKNYKPKLDMARSQSSQRVLASWEAYAWKQGKYIFDVTEHNARTNSYHNPGLSSHSGAIRRVLAKVF